MAVRVALAALLSVAAAQEACTAGSPSIYAGTVKAIDGSTLDLSSLMGNVRAGSVGW